MEMLRWIDSTVEMERYFEVTKKDVSGHHAVFIPHVYVILHFKY